MVDNKKIRFRHLHEFNEDGTKGRLTGTLAMYVSPGTRFAALGYSLVNPADNGRRDVGREMAIKRLEEEMAGLEEGDLPFGLSIDVLMRMEDDSVRDMCLAHVSSVSARMFKPEEVLEDRPAMTMRAGQVCYYKGQRLRRTSAVGLFKEFTNEKGELVSLFGHERVLI